ncbi:MAG: MBL fold metallo-hydrolase [Candidatus Omnitrophica bacterium]|nr:MBL fold metallo-hydrolase [Candidatus Omnitrophota bacterium]
MVENIRWLGHASFKITDNKIIYLDPWKLADGEKADLILITHSHYDHCSREDITKIQKPETVIVAPADAASQLTGNVKVAKTGDKITAAGIEIEVVCAYNSEKNFHPKAAGGVGYILTIEGKRIYHTGDTDLIPEMEGIKADVLLVPVGGTYTMDAREAAEAVKLIKPEIAIPMHYGDIVGSPEDAEEFKKLASCPVEILTRD